MIWDLVMFVLGFCLGLSLICAAIAIVGLAAMSIVALFMGAWKCLTRILGDPKWM